MIFIIIGKNEININNLYLVLKTLKKAKQENVTIYIHKAVICPSVRPVCPLFDFLI